MDKKWALVVLGGILMALVAFAPLAYAQEDAKALMKESREMIDQAKAAGAVEYAPYYYSLAEAYYELGTDELAEYDLPGAVEFFQKAKDNAGTAINRTSQAKSSR